MLPAAPAPRRSRRRPGSTPWSPPRASLLGTGPDLEPPEFRLQARRLLPARGLEGGWVDVRGERLDAVAAEQRDDLRRELVGGGGRRQGGQVIGHPDLLPD